MDWDATAFIVLIIALSYAGWLVNNWIRAKHGYALEDEWGGKSEKLDTGETKRLREENAELRELLGKVDKRMQVLERIVTDRGYSVAEEIEALRHDRNADGQDAGVSLDIKGREKA